MLITVSANTAIGIPQPLNYFEMVQYTEPMDTGGLERDLVSALNAYYEQACGGIAKWQKVQSLRLEGFLRLPHGDVQFIAFKKKPAYCKIVLKGAEGYLMVLSYDGEDAWQLVPSQSNDPVSMPPAEAANFIRDAVFGSHLLYPSIAGKEIRYDGNEEIDGWICRNFSVLLPNGDRIQYSLGLGNSKLRRQAVYNHVSGLTETTVNHEFEDLEGISIPTRSTMLIDGSKIHEVMIYDLQFNLGVMPWMFSRPSGAFIPKASENSEAFLDFEFDQAPLNEFQPGNLLFFEPW
ncbi:MAG: hypothetical protein AAGH40_06255 [Verrucomicrobiota bacterium]